MHGVSHNEFYIGEDAMAKKGVLNITNPKFDYVPYVYENFRWEHCSDAGYLETLINTDIVTSA